MASREKTALRRGRLPRDPGPGAARSARRGGAAPVLLLGGLGLFAGAPGAKAEPPAVLVSIEVIANPVEGPSGPKCTASARIEAYRTAEWWIALSPSHPPEEAGSRITCGNGSFETVPEATRAAAVLRIGVSARAWILPRHVPYLDIAVSSRTLSGSEAAAGLDDHESSEKRTFFFSDFFSETEDALIPIVASSPRTQEALGLHEAYLRVEAERAGRSPGARYGIVAVSSDLEEAEVLLDGGIVGRITKGEELVLRNVVAGERELRVRDSSGLDIGKIVRVTGNRTTPVALNPPGPARSASTRRLVAIGPNPSGYEEYRRERDGAIVVKIPEGEFLMGNQEAERQPLEHRVHVSGFLMDKTAVTWRQYKRFAGATSTALPPHEPYWGIHDDQPAVFVTWDEANAYCEWAGARLPTEAEREKAARGTDGRMYPWGNEEPDSGRAVFRRSWGHHAGTDAVGAHPSGASPYGLLDMGGNVWEWCADWYDENYYAASPPRDPKGPPTGRSHVVRGGSWDSRPDVLSCSVRNWGRRGYREGDFGFRCAMEAPR